MKLYTYGLLLVALLASLWLLSPSLLHGCILGRNRGSTGGHLKRPLFQSRKYVITKCKSRTLSPPPNFTSSGSEENSDHDRIWNIRPSSRLFQSASIDVPTNFRTSSECIQPKAKLSRWNTVGTTHYQATIIGTVQPDLYRNSEDDEPMEPPFPNGRIWFSLLYHEEEQELEVNLVKAKYLPGRGLSQTPRDPFVKLFLLPDEENFQQSKVRRRTLSPKFHEAFKFPIKKEQVSEKTLRLSVYDVDKRKVRHSLGHVHVPLGKLDLQSNEIIWRDLDHSFQNSNSLGEIQVNLSCSPLNSRIKVGLERIRNISGIESGEAGVFVKVQLFHGRKLMKTKRTTLYHTTSHNGEILVNEHFNFAVSGRYFDSCSFVLTVFLAGLSPLVKDEPHGKVVIGPFMYARGEQLLHWQEMLTNPRNQVLKWHSLEPLVLD
ncbi:synaptotagmin-15-like isoform X2 [Limulus polyphemus]|uniref:Synaptotagmin-15-like isoform X2 n=1 Tax=Limulus polyphemus TaxID=6850 RepID=A0ABM1S8K0_LIMPO|nr:synaptotagmin-15-like isoform X2 [Limulus polyphemus]